MHDHKIEIENKIRTYGPIIKNIGFNPYPVANNIPDFANSVLFPEVIGTGLYVEFWEEQFDRCLNGYKTGGLRLPGFFYEYLNFNTIDGPRGPTPPDFIDLHYEMSVAVEEIKKYNIPGIIMPKARRKGISFFGTMIVNHGIRFIDRYRFGLAAGLETYCDGFRLKLYRTYNVVPPEMRVNHLIRADDHFKVGYEMRTEQGFQERVNAEGFFKTMFDKAEKLEGEYFNDVFLEEAGQFPLVSEVQESIAPALKDGEKWVGTFYVFGTGGNVQKSSKQFKQLWHAADILGFVKFFIPGKRFYFPYLRRNEGEVYTPNLDKKYPDLKPEQLLGCEDTEAAAESIDAELTNLMKLIEKSKYIKFKQNYPKIVEDVFTSSGTNHFNIEKMYAQAYEIDGQEKKYVEYYLDWVRDEDGEIEIPLEVRFRLPDETTPKWKIIKVFKMPQPDIRNLDVAGIDGYNEDKTDTTKSLGAMVVLRQYDKFPFMSDAKDMPGIVPVLLFYERPPIKEQFWEICLMISVAYNLIGNTMISAESDNIIKFYKDEGCKRYLARRPRSFDAPYSKVHHDYGVKMTTYSKPKMLSVVQSWIEKFVQFCWFIEIINDGIAYDAENIGTDWDSIDATGLAIMRIMDMKVKIRHSAEEKSINTNLNLPSYRTVDGEMEQYFDN